MHFDNLDDLVEDARLRRGEYKVPVPKTTKTAEDLREEKSEQETPQTTTAVVPVTVSTAAVAVVPPEPDVSFTPTRLQRRLRAEFYAKTRGILLDMQTLDIETVQRYVTHDLLHKYWGDVEFRIWFKNADEAASRIRYLTELQLDNIEKILVNEGDVYSVSAVMSAGKQLMELKRAYEDSLAFDGQGGKSLPNDEVTVKRLAQQMLEAKKQMDRVKERAEGRTVKVELPS